MRKFDRVVELRVDFCDQHCIENKRIVAVTITPNFTSVMNLKRHLEGNFVGSFVPCAVLF